MSYFVVILINRNWQLDAVKDSHKRLTNFRLKATAGDIIATDHYHTNSIVSGNFTPFFAKISSTYIFQKDRIINKLGKMQFHFLGLNIASEQRK